MDSIMEVQMEVLLAQVPVDKELKAVLLGQASKFRPLYQLMLAQESGEWEHSTRLAAELKLTDEEVTEKWWQAMQWAQTVTSGV
jgi:c-di-GMP-related signal transduction protein